MNLAVCPTLLFIEDNDWKIDSKKELFLRNLDIIFDYSISKNVKIFWNDILEELLWCHPDLHPWLDPSNYRIIETLHKCIIDINVSKEYTACSINPDIHATFVKYDLITPTLSIIHYILVNEINFSFIVDVNNYKEFNFYCDCHRKSIRTAAKNVDFLQDEFFLNDYLKKNWDKLCNDSNLLKDLIFKIQSKLFPYNKINYDICFESSFLHSLKTVLSNEKREFIINKIVYRLTLSKFDTSKVMGFKDEPVNGTKKTRRFRINDASRVHYYYGDNNKFTFSDFYTESEHDKGL